VPWQGIPCLGVGRKASPMGDSLTPQQEELRRRVREADRAAEEFQAQEARERGPRTRSKIVALVVSVCVAVGLFAYACHDPKAHWWYGFLAIVALRLGLRDFFSSPTE
jgi:hypothetical protein